MMKGTLLDQELLATTLVAYDAGDDAVYGYFRYPLVFQAAIHEDRIQILMTFNTTVVDQLRIEALGHHLRHVVR